MTYIITTRTKESILMASDSRLNYFNDKIINNEKYQETLAFADCIRKTFVINNAKIGIQFSGIGYFPDINDEKYPLSYFIEKLNKEKYVKNFKQNAKVIFNFLKKISIKGDSGQYIRGVMSGFNKKNKPYVCIFNTFNNEFTIKYFNQGEIIDSEKDDNSFLNKEGLIEEINRRINKKSKEKFWTIGGPVEILKITKDDAIFVKKNKEIFNGTLKELVDCFNNNLKKINGQILKEPHLEKYTI